MNNEITESDKRKFNDLLKGLGLYNEDKKFRKEGYFDLNGNPSFDIKENQINLNWAKKFKDDDIEINISVNGKPIKLVSDKGDDSFRCDFSITKKF